MLSLDADLDLDLFSDPGLSSQDLDLDRDLPGPDRAKPSSKPLVEIAALRNIVAQVFQQNSEEAVERN